MSTTEAQPSITDEIIENVLPFDINDAISNFKLPTDISWDLISLEPLYAYIKSYGLNLAELNVGFTRGI